MIKDINDIKTEVITHEYENGHVSYTVVTKYEAHTLYNQITCMDEVDTIRDNHINYIVSIYVGSCFMYDPLSKTIVAREEVPVDVSTKKKSRKKIEDDRVEIEENLEVDYPDGEDEEWDDEKIEELGTEPRYGSLDGIGEDEYTSYEDYYDNDNGD